LDYLSRNPVTGLLIAKDDHILCEHYQYGRTDRDRLISQSTAKSITGMLIGAAIAEGAIKSVDDAAETYVAEFKGTEYGATPIRDLLHMSSGVDFGETKDGQRDLNRLWIDMVLGMGPTHGTIESIVQSIWSSPMGGQPGKPKPIGNPPIRYEPPRRPPIEEPPRSIPPSPVERPPLPVGV
jgi:hypothetical protein